VATNLITELVIANRILANEDVVDAYGHVSVRNPEAPERFFLAHSKSPALVEAGDIVEHSAAGQAYKSEQRPLYLERFIHAAIYEARPDVMAVVHAHAEDVLPFSITKAALRPVIHSGAFIGAEVPVWDIAERFGDRTNLLVTNLEQGRDLAKALGERNVALMRGHGFAAAARSLIDVVRMAVYLPRNARVQYKAMQMGPLKPLSTGEIDARAAGTGYKPQSPETQRAWQYWAQRAGCADLLTQANRVGF
jgi:ribulose-5-phosphate 4-epimerase/fuculose-1-phosphate aldolase